MVYNTQIYWVFGLLPSSGILENRKHDVSERDTVSETSCFLFSRIPDDGKSHKASNSVVLGMPRKAYFPSEDLQSYRPYVVTILFR
jgi:hypothetical protein